MKSVILLADAGSNRVGLEAELTYLGYGVRPVDSLEAFNDELNRDGVSVLVIDLFLRSVDGLRLSLESVNRRPDLPIVCIVQGATEAVFVVEPEDGVSEDHPVYDVATRLQQRFTDPEALRPNRT